MQKQQLQQSLQQRLSPQQIQIIRMLELPAIEMEERIRQELEENPALEEGREPLSDGETDGAEADETIYESPENETDLTLGDYLTEDDIPDYQTCVMNGANERREDIPFSAGPSLHDFLVEQLSLRNLTEEEKKIGEYIIGNIDDDGYLRRELSAIADDLMFKAGVDVNESDIEPTLKVIQDFEPIGIGARNLQECLRIQLEKKEQTPYTRQAAEIIDFHFEAFIRKHYDKIQRALNIDDETLRAVLHEITALNPKPGNGWNESSESAMNEITPDFIVENHNGELTLSMNQRDVPDLRISREYSDMFRDYAGNKTNRSPEMRNAVQFVKQKLDAAQWFINAVRQRQETLQRTMEAIVVLQNDFFLTGDEAKLRPMILKDVAERAGYDISTISRVSNSKYVQTNFGIFPLKYFFSESARNDSGEEISTREIKQIMRETIDAEDKQNPVTDDALSVLLKEKGYRLARRTVAKYREQMGIPVARLRKEI